MRIDSKLVHPALWAKLDEYEHRLWSGYEGGVGRRAHQQAWWKAYGSGCAWSLSAYAGLCALGVWIGKTQSTPFPFILAMFACGAHAMWQYQRNRRLLTVEELDALLPHLEAGPRLELYAESIADIYRHPMDAGTRREAILELNALMDDDQTLEAARSRVDAAIARADVAAIDADIAQLSARMEATADPIARGAYEESLQLARERREAASRFQPLLDRIDAQQEVVRQTLLRVRADLGRTSAPGVHAPIVGSVSIREALARIRNHADEIDRAIQELDQPSGNLG